MWMTSEPISSALLPLSELELGESGRVDSVNLEGKLRDYVSRFGFVDGALVSVVHRVPLGNLSVYRIGHTDIALRPETACEILVVREPS